MISHRLPHLNAIHSRLSSCLHGSSSSCLHQKQATVTKKTPYDFQEAGDHVRNGAVFFVLETLLHIERIIDPSATHFQEYIDGIFEDVEEGEFDIDDDIIL